MEIDSAEFTNEERLEACEWMDATGRSCRDVRYCFTVEPALPGSVKMTFEQYLKDERGRHRISGDRSLTEQFVIYASDRLGWLQHFLLRTGRQHELARP